VDRAAVCVRFHVSARAVEVQIAPARADKLGVLPSIVLIAEPEQLDVLRQRPDYAGALAFTDSETPSALEAILIHQPGVIVVERVFAAKSRGAALINRIKADPSLEACEIRIVAHDSSFSRVAPRQGPPASAAGGGGTAAAVAAPPVALDQKGTRRAQRYKIIAGIEVLIDGNPALLVDLSTVGAQVVSATLLKPNQRVRLSFIESARPVRFSAGVAWSAFELPKGEPRYRAGIEFFDADPEAVTRFCNTNRSDG
jgi:hypothetical protein